MCDDITDIGGIDGISSSGCIHFTVIMMMGVVIVVEDMVVGVVVVFVAEKPQQH